MSLLTEIARIPMKIDPLAEALPLEWDINRQLEKSQRLIQIYGLDRVRFSEEEYKSEIGSTPHDLINVYSTTKPSVLTHGKFANLFAGHEFMALFAYGPYYEIANYVVDPRNANAQSLIKVIQEEKERNPELTERLDNEYQIYRDVVSNLWLVSAKYLNSLDIPISVKDLYPSAERPIKKEMKAREYAFGIKESKMGVWESFLEKHREGIDRFIGKTLNFADKHEKALVYGILLPMGILMLPFTLSYFAYSFGKKSTAKLINKTMSRLNPDFAPLSEGNEYEKYWLYFKYHPEKDVPPNFDDELFNPSPEICRDYFPRKLVKVKVYDLYDSMVRAKRYYSINEIPANNKEIKEAREAILFKISSTNEFARSFD